ncbi:MAG TPA: hypothetical protein V6D03_16050 [Candidatus Caenarcaniphilales bacterium]
MSILWPHLQRKGAGCPKATRKHWLFIVLGVAKASKFLEEGGLLGDRSLQR